MKVALFNLLKTKLVKGTKVHVSGFKNTDITDLEGQFLTLLLYGWGEKALYTTALYLCFERRSFYAMNN